VNILLTSNKFYPDVGGIEAISALLASGFIQAGHEVCLVTQSPNHKQSDLKFPYRILRRPTARQLFATYSWAHIVLQVNLEVRQLWPLLFYNKPLIIGIQSWPSMSKPGRLSILRLKPIVLWLADQVIACSSAVKKEVQQPAVIIGNPYNANLFQRVTVIPKTNSIVFLGRLVSDKGADMIIRAFAALQLKTWRLTIIGVGPERGPLEEMASSLGIREAVDFLGCLQGEALVNSLNHHEIMVVPSRWREPFGVVALEGLACGCVVLAADDGGLLDAVGSAGIFFRRNDQQDLQNKLALLVNDDNLRNDLRLNAVSHLPKFRHDAVSKHYLEVVNSVIKKKKIN